MAASQVVGAPRALTRRAVHGHDREKERTMPSTFLRQLVPFAILGFATAGFASAEECSGVISADEALAAETARYAAQTSNDFAAMEKLFGNDLVYQHSSAAVDGKASYIDAMRSGRAKYRKMTPNADVTTRTYGCLALITGTALYEVTSGGQDRSVPLRYTAIWAKRPSGIQFVSWQSTGIPPKQ
jgi:ketosteroid isomerase-like protein